MRSPWATRASSFRPCRTCTTSILTHSHCTRRTDDYGSSVYAKPSDQPPSGTADRERLTSPRIPSSEGDPNAAMPFMPPPSRPTPPGDEGDLGAALSVTRTRLLATNSGRCPSLRAFASNPVPRSTDSLPTVASARGAPLLLSHTRGQQRLSAGSHKPREQRLSVGSHKP